MGCLSRAGSFRSLPGLCAALLVVGLTGCTYSTLYVPQRTDRLALTLDDNVLVLRQGRQASPAKEAGLGGFGRVPVEVQSLLACDERSFDHYLVAQDHFEQAQLFDWGSVASMVIGLLALPALPIMVWASLALDLVSDNQTALGLADLIDAINRHNDAVACSDLDAWAKRPPSKRSERRSRRPRATDASAGQNSAPAASETPPSTSAAAPEPSAGSSASSATSASAASSVPEKAARSEEGGPEVGPVEPSAQNAPDEVAPGDALEADPAAQP